jgi:hypothetical protein
MVRQFEQMKGLADKRVKGRPFQLRSWERESSIFHYLTWHIAMDGYNLIN